ncbi:MAG: hypothetical protein ACI8PZ_003308 [Myxococcota bacterium]
MDETFHLAPPMPSPSVVTRIAGVFLIGLGPGAWLLVAWMLSTPMEGASVLSAWLFRGGYAGSVGGVGLGLVQLGAPWAIPWRGPPELRHRCPACGGPPDGPHAHAPIRAVRWDRTQKFLLPTGMIGLGIACMGAFMGVEGGCAGLVLAPLFIVFGVGMVLGAVWLRHVPTSITLEVDLTDGSTRGEGTRSPEGLRFEARTGWRAPQPTRDGSGHVLAEAMAALSEAGVVALTASTSIRWSEPAGAENGPVTELFVEVVTEDVYDSAGQVLDRWLVGGPDPTGIVAGSTADPDGVATVVAAVRDLPPPPDRVVAEWRAALASVADPA